MKKYGVIIDMTSNSLAFWPSHCIYIRSIFFITLRQPRSPTDIVVVRIEKDIIPQKMLKRGSKKNMTDFL